MSWGSPGNQSATSGVGSGRREAVELIGTHLRLNGQIALGRFSRLSDYVNSSIGYVRVFDARLLRRNGDPTNLVLPEMMVDQDEISFIAQHDPLTAGTPAPTPTPAVEAGLIGDTPPGQAEPDLLDTWGTLGAAAPAGGDVWGLPGGQMGGGAQANRPSREFVMFTPGHTITGHVQVFGETDLAGFVDASEPRYVPVVDATARSLADRRIISHFKFLLINRTHMIAASEIGRRGDITHEDVPDL